MRFTNLLPSRGGFGCRARHQVGSREKCLVLTLDCIDSRGPPTSLSFVEDVVVNQRADLNQLYRDSRSDDSGIEYTPNVGDSDGQGRTKALATTTHHSEARSRQVWCADPAGCRESVTYRRQMLGKIRWSQKVER